MLEREAPIDYQQSILRSLPLEKCSFETNPVTGERGWRAPKDHSFRITGHFEVGYDVSDFLFWMDIKQPSFDILRDENKEFYKDCVRKAKDKDDAKRLFLEHLNEDDTAPAFEAPDSFTGKLIVPNYKNGELSVEKDLEADYDQNVNLRLSNITPDSGIQTEVFVPYPAGEGIVWWIQFFATGIEGKSKIELIELEDKIPELFVPEKIDRSEIKVIKKYYWSLESRCREIERVHSRKLSDQEKYGMMVSFRKRGIPFREDPLKEFIFPEKLKIIFPKEG